jgi:hypothetical protein
VSTELQNIPDPGTPEGRLRLHNKWRRGSIETKQIEWLKPAMVGEAIDAVLARAESAKALCADALAKTPADMGACPHSCVDGGRLAEIEAERDALRARVTDELDQLSDAALSEVFAVEVAGWTRTGMKARHLAWNPPAKFPGFTPPPYATSADAVLPHLDADGWGEMNHTRGNGQWRVRVKPMGVVGFAEGRAPTFARAACIALIRAKRAVKGAPTPAPSPTGQTASCRA